MKHPYLAIFLVAACSAVLPAGAQDAEDPAAWRDVSPENLLLIDVPAGQVAVELAPAFAPNHVEQMRRLARTDHYDGKATFYRVIEGFVAQGGVFTDNEADPDRAYEDGVETLAAEFERSMKGAPGFVPLGFPDLYAPETGHSAGFAVGRDPKTAKLWLLHCAGAVAMARDPDPDTGSSHFYVVIGRDQRYLDRNLSVFGRVIDGMEHLQRLKRGRRAVGNGVIPVPADRDPIQAVRLASTLPAEERPAYQVMRVDVPAFEALKQSKRYRDSDFFRIPPTVIEACGVLPPARERPEGLAFMSDPAGLARRYRDLYFAGDVAALEPHLSDDAHFHDSASRFDGTQAVIDGLTAKFADISNMKWDQRDVVVSGQDHVFRGRLDFDSAGRAFGVPGRTFHFSVDFSMALTIVDGKVRSHVDYVDTDAFQEQLARQRE